MTSISSTGPALRGGTSRGLVVCAAALALAAGAAAQLPRMTFIGTNLPSDGRAWPHATSSLNGVLTQTAAGASFAAGTLKITGTAHKVSGTNNYPGQMHVMIRNVTKGTSFASANIFTNFNLPWTTVSTTGTSFDASSLGTIDAGDQIEVRFHEAFDDPGSPDTLWDSVTVELFVAPPSNTSGITTFDEQPCPCPPIVVGPSDFDAGLALYSLDGELIDSDDGMSAGPAEVSFDGLPSESFYYVAVASAGSGFADGFEVAPGPGSGTDGVVRLTREGSIFFETRMHETDVVWHVVELSPPACPADLDGDGEVGLLDLSALLVQFGSVCP